MRRASLLLVLLLLPGPAAWAGSGTGSIELRVVGLRSEAGSVRMKLVAHPEGFPGSEEHVVAKQKLPARADGVSFLLPPVPYGDYALVVLHDEDDDSELDRGWLGIPREGLGFSNGARVRMGPPAYESARFTLSAPELRMTVELHYP